MNKTVKGIIIAVVSVAVLAGLAAGGLLIYKKASAGAVKVYQVSNFAMMGSDMMGSETSGMVTLDNLQRVQVSDTQQVTGIFVEEGQEVKKGDKLVSFDTTLSDIELKKSEINLERTKLQLEQAQKELRRINSLSPYSSVLVTPEPLGIVYTPHETKVVIAGAGTSDSPYYYLWDENDTLNISDMDELLSAVRSTDPEAAEVWVTFVVRENNALNAPVLRSFGLLISEETDESGSADLVWSFYEPVLSEEIMAYEEEPEPYYQESGSPYTSKQISEMRAAQQNTIKDLEIAVQMAQVDFDRMQMEVNDGTVVSKIDGIVKAVRDPETCAMTGEPLIELSGGGGYLIDVAMSEMELGTLQVGDTVMVQSWQSGQMLEGTVVETSEYPTTSANSWSSGNQNVSYYPFKVAVSEDANLQEYEWVGVTYSTNRTTDGFYLQKMFVRSESGRSYVYVEKDGRLEQRFISTGAAQWDNLMVKGGLSMNDWIAFPYGSDTVAGADTEHADAQDLYDVKY